jgi:hypothetical protein
MLKDPVDSTETAYELLGLPFDASLEDVRAALKRFMKDPRQRHKMAAAAQAQKKLQSPAGRAELDVWLYDIKVAEFDPGPATTLDLDDLTRPCVLPASELYSDLAGADLEADKRKITPQRMKFGDSRVFDNVESIRFSPHFDR